MKQGQKIANFVFQCIFFVVNFFIFIGETTQKFILLILSVPIFLLSQIGLFVLYLLKKIKLVRIKLPRIKIRKPRLSLRLKSLLIKTRFFVLGCLVTLLAVSIYQGYLFIKNLPSPTYIGKVNYALTTHIYDRNGTQLYEVYREQNRTPIKLSDLPSFVLQATLAAEDKDFYRHNGISIFGGIIRALKDTAVSGQLEGGSTITQQLVKSALLTPERTIPRKIKEIILALWAEKLYSKDQILEMYFNQVPYGGATYGIEEAAKTYFGKPAKSLSLVEAATLAGLPQAPSYYSPYFNPQVSLWRRNAVLTAMYQQSMINRETFDKALTEPFVVLPAETTIKAPHFVFYVRQELEQKFGIKEVEEGGMQVVSSLDLTIQREGEKILQEELNKIKNLKVTNGAILVTKPSTGEILAMVGSSDYFNNLSGAYNVTTALRQPGSAIKPIMYSLALKRGFTAATILDDSPVIFTGNGIEPYQPVNYDSRFHGKIPLRYALANSYNVPAVKTLNAVGVNDFISHAQAMGITTWTETARYGLSLTLGGGEVKMTDMAVAYGVLANLGIKSSLTGWTKITDSTGALIDSLSISNEKVLDSGIAYILSDILSDNFARQWAFGQRSNLEIPGYRVAVKTGTTNDKKDNWTIGYTPEFMVLVWVGNNDGTPMDRYLTSGVTGAAPIWSRMMSYLLKNYGNSKTWYQKPEDVVEKNCFFGRKEYFIAGSESKTSCTGSVLNITLTPTIGYRTMQ